MSDNQELERREIMRSLIATQLHGLKNDYAILSANHSGNIHAIRLMEDIKNQIDCWEKLSTFYKK